MGGRQHCPSPTAHIGGTSSEWEAGRRFSAFRSKDGVVAILSLRSVGVLTSRGHTKAWESITPTRGAMPKRGSPSPQLKGPQQSVEAHDPDLRGHTEVWESLTPIQGATPKLGSP